MSAMDLLMSVWRYAAYNIAMLKAGDTSEPDAADKDFFQRLRREVERQISGYVYQVHAGAMGTPLPVTIFALSLTQCRSISLNRVGRKSISAIRRKK
jgi:hypothetical protein